jgi:hypothetical protein
VLIGKNKQNENIFCKVKTNNCFIGFDFGINKLKQFIIDNLNFFINSRNAAVKGYNLNVSEEKINRLKEQREEYIGENIYS